MRGRDGVNEERDEEVRRRQFFAAPAEDDGQASGEKGDQCDLRRIAVLEGVEQFTFRATPTRLVRCEPFFDKALAFEKTEHFGKSKGLQCPRVIGCTQMEKR
jgi:hypothetical protein